MNITLLVYLIIHIGLFNSIKLDIFLLLDSGIKGRNVTVPCSSALRHSSALIGDTLPIGIGDSGDTLADVTFSADWVEVYPCCDNDTTIIVFRQFDAFDRVGKRYTGFDTIVFLRLPVIDTMVCVSQLIGDSIVLKNGIYQVQVNNSSSCQQTYNVTVLDTQFMSISVDRSVLCGLGDSISVIASDGFSYYQWSNDQEGLQIEVSKPTKVAATGISENGCKSKSDTIEISKYDSFVEQSICAVTYDRERGENVILFDKSDTRGIGSYVIFTDVLGEFVPIDTIKVDSIPLAVHFGSRPENQSHIYKIGTIDSCGIYKESPNSGAVHKSILLQSNIGTAGEVNLNWNPYEGREIQIYEIWLERDTGQDTMIDKLGPNNYNYIWRDVPAGDLKFYVKGVFQDTCVIETTESGRNLEDPLLVGSTTSNYTEQLITSIFGSIEQQVSIFPNPAGNSIGISGIDDHIATNIKLYDPSGRLLYHTSRFTNQMNISFLKPGYYLIEIKTQRRTYHRRFIKL